MNNIKIYRVREGLQLKDMAIATGLSIGHLSHLENSGRLPSVASMEAIANFLKRSVPDVFYASEADAKAKIEVESRAEAAEHADIIEDCAPVRKGG